MFESIALHCIAFHADGTQDNTEEAEERKKKTRKKKKWMVKDEKQRNTRK